MLEYILGNDIDSVQTGFPCPFPLATSLVIDLWVDVELTDFTKNLLVYWEDKSYTGNHNDQLPLRTYGQEVTFDYTDIKPFKYSYELEGIICATPDGAQECGDNPTRKIYVSFHPHLPPDIPNLGNPAHYSALDGFGLYIDGVKCCTDVYTPGDVLNLEIRGLGDSGEFQFQGIWYDHDATVQYEIKPEDVKRNFYLAICFRNNDGYTSRKTTIDGKEHDGCRYSYIPVSE